MAENNIKTAIQKSINAFASGNLFENATSFFKTLGYNTERSASLSKSTFASFKETFILQDSKFNESIAIVEEWKYVNLLFQLSTEEMKQHDTLFKPSVERNDPASYIFFAIELTKNNYSRNQLAQIAREINKPFPMHVFVIFKYGNQLTLSLIDRRAHKKIIEKDVIEKVTHVYNVNIDKPHAAHIQILFSFSLDAIKAEAPKRRIESFKDLQNGWRKVISTDILNKQFYLDYQHLSVKLINTIHPKQVKNKLAAHQGVLNLLNRIMFIYFVQKKEWIMKDENFINHFWKAYLNTGSKDKFHSEWLNSVFFSAFNGVAYKDPKAIKALPEPYKTAIINFPYLNGGLFAFSDDYDNFTLTDASFNDIFNFFEGYIFTIAEDTPYDVNLEINPELLGKMYEGMINATDLDDVDAENGIIYTERPEINFMSRRSFVEVLDKKLSGTVSREFLYHFIFDTPEQKKEILKRYKANTTKLREAICTITACDPSCGSGSMILGVIQLQMELIRVLDEYDKKPHTPKDDFNIKKQLISECIYGVDIKEWAVRIAELRLWLYMIAEAEFTQDELTKTPLLPNLDFKLRKGNSLLQKFGNLDFTIDDLLKGRNKTTGAARKLNDFIRKKKAFIQNQSDSKTTYRKLKDEEFIVFIQFIDELIIELEQKIHNRNVKAGKQTGLFGDAADQKNIFEEEIEELRNEKDALKKLKATIKKEGRLPFSYDIDFMEVFLTNDNPGFDLMIGNPPYVRQEQILPPEDGEYLEYLLLPENKVEKAEINKEYKESLNKKVYKTFPFLESNVKTQIEGKSKTVPIYGSKVPGRSDLYCYFQLLCPSYLNSNGTFCFIIGNSWLDVEFGAYVQHFLLKHTKLHAIYDCNVRSFDAKVNTIIYLHSALENIPQQIGGAKGKFKLVEPINNSVQFIMNKIDYAQASYAPLLLEQEHCKTNTFKELYRVIPTTQKDLYFNGYDEEQIAYIGDKWGGKWLHSPEIYFNILLKGGTKICKVKDLISYSQRNTLEAFTTFEETKTPNDNDIPFLDSSKILHKIHHKPKEITHHIKLKSAKYKAGFEKYKVADVLSNRFVGDRIFFVQGDDYVVGDTFFVAEFKEKKNKELYLASLNSTISILNVLVTGRKNMGDGVLLFYGPEFRNLQIVLPSNSKKESIEKIYFKIKNRKINTVLIELGFNNIEPIREQQPNPLPDRKELDEIIFDEIGLTQSEINEVYWSVAELVKQRIDKAASR